MRLTIIPSDQFAAIDGVGYNGVDMSSVAVNVHAVQWSDDAGWIEFVVDPDGTKQANEVIDSIAQFQPVIDSWNAIDYAHKHPDPVEPTADQNKRIAEQKLSSTDWSQLPDVNIANRDEYASYRAAIRGYVLTPVAGFIDWPAEPHPVWL